MTNTGNDAAERFQADILIDPLSDLFARILQLPSVDPDENFFDLGGDSLRAVTLLADAKRKLGLHIPFAAIYDTPTVRGIATQLAARRDHLSNSLILMRPGVDGPPLFLVSGVGGTAFELRQLANRIDTNRAVYALQSRGLDGVTAPLSSIAEMARFYIEEIRRVQSIGPYSIVGYSMGGLVAFEMARRLLDENERMAILIMIDTDLPGRSWPLRTVIRVWSQIAKSHLRPGALGRAIRFHIASLRWLLQASDMRDVCDRLRRAGGVALNVHRLERHLSHAIVEPFDSNAGDRRLDTVKRVSRANRAASAAYKASAYAGDIVFLQSETPGPIRVDPLLWRPFVRSMEVRVVKGDHMSMVRVHSDRLADTISRYLNTSRPEEEAQAAATGAVPELSLAAPVMT